MDPKLAGYGRDYDRKQALMVLMLTHIEGWGRILPEGLSGFEHHEFGQTGSGAIVQYTVTFESVHDYINNLIKS